MAWSCWKIIYPRNIVEDVESPTPGTLWDIASNGSSWVHPDTVITTPPNSSPSQVRTSLHNYEVDVPITFPPYIIGSHRLVGVDYRWFSCCVIQTQSTTPDGIQDAYRNYLMWPKFSYERQKSRFHPNAVGVRQLFLHHFIKGIFSQPRE